jgi:tRNA(fMet)-specific endonuclease VapC
LIQQELERLEPSQVKIPSMVRAELLHGAAKSAHPKRNHELVELFLTPFEVVAFDKEASAVYAQIRSNLERAGSIIGFNDLIIAATVMAHSGSLVSANVREFKRIQGLHLETWAEITH